MTLGKIDYYVLKPQRCPDELFHRTVAEFLFEWARHESPLQGEIEIVAELGSPRAAELRDLLSRNGIPYACHVARLDRRPGAAQRRRPRGPDRSRSPRSAAGRFIVDPTNVELADAFGVSTELGERARVRRRRDRRRPGRPRRGRLRLLGGDAGAGDRARGDRRPGRLELADPQLPRLLARGERLRPRPARLPAGLGLRDEVPADARGRRAAAGRETARAQDLRRRRNRDDRCPARLRASPTAGSTIPSLSCLEGEGVFYGASAADAKGLPGKRVFVVGGGNSAGQAAMHLSRYAARVTMLVRRRDRCRRRCPTTCAGRSMPPTNIDVHVRDARPSEAPGITGSRA